MSIPATEIRIYDQEVHTMLNQLLSRSRNLSPVMRQISGIIHDAVEENFEKEGRPRWKPLKPSTIKQREREGKGTGRILQRSGSLAASCEPGHNATSAWVGTNKRYAATQHFGARKGQFGRTKRGGPIPWGDIPARPFLKLTSRDIGGIKMALMNYLLKGR